jgi:transposase
VPALRELVTKRRGSYINDLTIQVAALDKCMDFMGMDFWVYTHGSRRHYKWRAQMLLEVRRVCGFNLSYETLLRWIAYYHKYGEPPAKSRRSRPTIKGIRMTKGNLFTKLYLTKLEEIVENHPQLYLDEIQLELYHQTGRMWSSSTIWRKLHTIGYSLKKAVLRAKQQSQQEVDEYFVRLQDRLGHPRQLIYIDETARSQLASRRPRAWSPFGVTPIVAAPMVREHDKRYSLIAACNWEGFIPEACHIVEREYGSEDKDPERGTVDAERFEHYLEEHLIPVLGKAINQETNSIVVMDNASIHNSSRVREMIEATGALLIYTAPYSPEYNPIECMFGEYKKNLKRLSYSGTLHWLDVHHRSIRMVTPKQAKAFYSHCKVPMIDDWVREHERNKSNGVLPEPFNELFEAIWDLL